MSSFTTKKVEQQFSTTQLQDHRSYSSRFSRSKPRKSQLPSLPYHQQKSAIAIQRWWRFRMAMRRRFYQRLLQQLYYQNQVMRAIVCTKQKYLEGICAQNRTIEHIAGIKLERCTKKDKQIMKSLAKQCVSTAFKMEKRMISQEQLQRALSQKKQTDENIKQLKNRKMRLQEQLIQNSSKSEQMFLRQIKEANCQLLKIVSERNNLKQKLKQKTIDQAQ